VERADRGRAPRFDPVCSGGPGDAGAGVGRCCGAYGHQYQPPANGDFCSRHFRYAYPYRYGHTHAGATHRDAHVRALAVTYAHAYVDPGSASNTGTYRSPDGGRDLCTSFQLAVLLYCPAGRQSLCFGSTNGYDSLGDQDCQLLAQLCDLPRTSLAAASPALLALTNVQAHSPADASYGHRHSDWRRHGRPDSYGYPYL
jgi:hypothetical protein